MTTAFTVGKYGFVTAAILAYFSLNALLLAPISVGTTYNQANEMYTIKVLYPDYLQFMKESEKKADRRDVIQIRPGRYASDGAFPPTVTKGEKGCDTALYIVTSLWVIFVPFLFAIVLFCLSWCIRVEKERINSPESKAIAKWPLTERNVKDAVTCKCLNMEPERAQFLAKILYGVVLFLAVVYLVARVTSLATLSNCFELSGDELFKPADAGDKIVVWIEVTLYVLAGFGLLVHLLFVKSIWHEAPSNANYDKLNNSLLFS